MLLAGWHKHWIMISLPRSFAQIDVFTAQPGMGNPVAVVLNKLKWILWRML